MAMWVMITSGTGASSAASSPVSCWITLAMLIPPSVAMVLYAIIADLTDVMVKYGSPRENTHVILTEVSYDVWGKGGKTFAKRAEEQGITLPH